MENKFTVFDLLKPLFLFFLLTANCLRARLLLLLFLAGGLPIFSFCQYTKYWIQFTDKNNTPYSVFNPSQFLSARSIQRRLNQNIKVIQNDLPVNPAYIDSVKKVPNVMLLNRSRWFNAITIYTTDTNALNTIKAFPFVKKTQPVRRLCRNAEEEECVMRNPASETKFPLLNEGPASARQISPVIPNSSYNYGLSLNQVNMLGGVCMHDMGYDGKGMVIAILDIGFDRVDSAAAFDSLRANNQILGRWNFVDGNSTVTIFGNVHGTWCLSLMAGNIPGKLIGTAPKAKYWLLRTEDGASETVIEEDNWVSGAEFADSVGADILSTSLGYTEFDSVKIGGITVANPYSHSYKDMDGNTTRISIGTDIAASKGMLPVCAAGNSGWGSWHFIGAPADADSVLAVGAVDSLSAYVGFSSKGPSYDGQVKPNVAAQGDHPYVTDLGAGSYNIYSGTSFACPLVAGMAACLWQAHPGATSMQLFNAIQRSASSFTNPDTLTGYGIPDFCAAHDTLLLSVKENNLTDDIRIFPNPTTGKFRISASGSFQSIEVYNLPGEKVYAIPAIKGEAVSLPSGLGKGMYFIKINSEKGSVTKKLVIE